MALHDRVLNIKGLENNNKEFVVKTQFLLRQIEILHVFSQPLLLQRYLEEKIFLVSYW